MESAVSQKVSPPDESLTRDVSTDGTFLCSRYMQISNAMSAEGPPQATSVILDGVVSTSTGESQYGRMTFDQWPLNFEQV